MYELDKKEKIHKKNSEQNIIELPSILGNQAFSAGVMQCLTAPVRVNYTNGKNYENAAANDLIDTGWIIEDVQVPIRPNPTPANPAPKIFIADFMALDPVGTRKLIEAKYTAGGGPPRLTQNQSEGYSAVAAVGGTITSGPCQGPIGPTETILMHN